MDLEQKKVFAERLGILRTKQNLSQQQLAEKININRETIAKYETVKRIPSYEHLTKFAEYFHVSTDYLLGLQGEPTNNPVEITVTEYTGLTKEAVDKLHKISIQNKYTANSDTLSELIEDVDFEYFISLLAAKMCANNSTKTFNVGNAQMKIKISDLTDYGIERNISKISTRMKEEFGRKYTTAAERKLFWFVEQVQKKINEREITEQQGNEAIASYIREDFCDNSEV